MIEIGLNYLPLEATLAVNEPHHTKIGLKIFVSFIPKEGLAGTSPAQPSPAQQIMQSGAK